MPNDSCQDYVNRLQQVVSRANNLGVVGGGDDGDDDGRWVNQWGKQVGSIQYQNDLFTAQLYIVPLTLAAATAFYSLRSRAASVQPLRFVPSGEPSSDHQNLERIREDWKQRNQGIGLRDVSRSGGGV
ncbi:predicted protein [Lichtheimia corymbifera JMRC:FSU:9682]|uniref:Uncharacterized protein n=1 Tax=Lichtheimia corymbifera JMRC:FSU:9682 TaxID=1263082 RepID=A0A068S6P7_9FUNG|nr:predicted protein [Lichtheimia corymbifera JMRC:FSU:9682]